MFIRPRQYDDVVERGLSVQRDISVKRLLESGEEQLHLMSLGDRCVPARQSHEAFGEVIDAAVTMKKRQLTDRAAGHWWPESLVHQLDKTWPQRWPGVEL